MTRGFWLRILSDWALKKLLVKASRQKAFVRRGIAKRTVTDPEGAPIPWIDFYSGRAVWGTSTDGEEVFLAVSGKGGGGVSETPASPKEIERFGRRLASWGKRFDAIAGEFNERSEEAKKPK